MRQTAPDATLRAALWMAGAVVSFCLMAVAARELTASMSPYQILFLRSLFGALFIGLVIVRRDPSIIRTAQPLLHVARHTIHFVGQISWIAALGVLPLALVFAVEFTSPIWGALAAVLLLGERLTGWRVFAMVAGFSGVLVIVRPGLTAFEPMILAVLLAAVAFGIINAMTKKLLETDRPWGILFWMCLSQTLLCLPFAAVLWVAPTLADLPWIAGVAVSGLTAHYCLTRALSLADAVVVLPMEFARLPLIAAIGFLAYGEPLDPWIFTGAVVIVAGIWLNLWAESRKAAQARGLSRNGGGRSG
jgi:drug/metabolite transporter (DMT)-like permease